MPFVVGVPRSGTTLLRLMLDAHSEVAIPPETYFLFAIVKAHRAGQVRGAEQLHALVTTASSWKDLGLSEDAYLERLHGLRPFSLSDGLRAFYALYAERFGKRRSGDKTPRYSLVMESIESLLPEARFIHVIRDGRDVALSLRETWFAPARDMPGLAEFWRYQVEHARSVGARCRHYLEVRYEALVERPSETLDQICRFVDLPFEAGMASYHSSAERRLSDLTPHYNADGTIRVSRERRLHAHRFAAQPPTRERVGRWRREMTVDEQRAFGQVAGDLLARLGYSV